MLKEAGDFAGHLKRCEKDIRALKNATEGGEGGGRAGAWLPCRGGWLQRLAAAALPAKVANWRIDPSTADCAPPRARRAGLLNTAKAVMSAPLPRVYEEAGGGKVVPVSAAGQSGGQPGPIGGVDFNSEEIAKISKETGKKLESEVLAPMERWMNAYNLVVVSRAGWGRLRVCGAERAGESQELHLIWAAPPDL